MIRIRIHFELVNRIVHPEQSVTHDAIFRLASILLRKDTDSPASRNPTSANINRILIKRKCGYQATTGTRAATARGRF